MITHVFFRQLSPEANKCFSFDLEISLEHVTKNLQKPVEIENLIKLRDFLPEDTTGFFRYEGSLTTPNCGEVVIWTVFSEPGHVTKDFWKLFRSVRSEDGPLKENYRSLQAQNNRVITLRRSTMPKSTAAFSNSANFILVTFFILFFKSLF